MFITRPMNDLKYKCMLLKSNPTQVYSDHLVPLIQSDINDITTELRHSNSSNDISKFVSNVTADVNNHLSRHCIHNLHVYDPFFEEIDDDDGYMQIVRPHDLLTIDEVALHQQYVEQRERDILDIERDVLQIHEMFTDLNKMICYQGQDLQRIEDYVNITRDQVKQAEEELLQAEVYQRSARSKYTYILALLMVPVVTVVAVVEVLHK